ncbi:MAG: Mur ligase family protein [Xanthomonadales bacterium]|nr:Mur ligase family protein [Xanthomonadales bacterium]
MEIKDKLWLLGAGRRSDKTVLEQRFFLKEEELAALQTSAVSLGKRLRSLLQETGIKDSLGLLDDQWSGTDHALFFCQLFTRLTIVLQLAAGHRVYDFGVAADERGEGCWLWFEYEHDAVAAAAVVLAMNMLVKLEPAIKLPDFEGEAVELQEVSWKGFLAVAKPRILPVETEAIIEAARHRRVPCVRLERIPYQGVEGSFRIRKNSLLKLGHGPYQLIVDGSLCVTRSAHLLPLLQDRNARRARLVQLQIPVPAIDEQAGNCALSKHALRAAERIGYPVLLTATATNGQRYSWPDVKSPDELRRTMDQARRHGSQIDVQASVSGENWQVLLVGSEIHALLRDGQPHAIGRLNAETRQQLEGLSGQLDSGVLRIHLCTTDITSSLEKCQGAVLDFDLAPRLDDWLVNHPDILSQLAGAFVSHLFPLGMKSRIPIVAVTGTNGKTTTCRMVEAIGRQAGLNTGMATTGGLYYQGQDYEALGSGGLGRQYKLFEREEVNFAVLEEYFGSILHNGFLYGSCEVAICTNVSEDHLGNLGVYTLGGIAATKALVVKKASKAAILNADNEYSLAMMATTHAENIGLVSVLKAAGDIQNLLDRPGRICVLEDVAGEDWLCIYQEGERIPLMPVNEIPSTYQGKAAHNTVNAMQAALAGHFLDFDLQAIRQALAGFQPDFYASKGRLNMMTGLPYQFLMDYAHNLDSFRVLCHFTNQLEVSGRRIICLPFSGDRQNSEIKQAIGFLAPHFDLFFCGSYAGLRGREPSEIGELITQYLQEAGVPPDRIRIYPERKLALELTIKAASPGDLVVFLAGGSDFKNTWAKMTELKEQQLSASEFPFTTT